MIKKIKEIIIIGAGPAGLTATIYAKRAKCNVLIIEKDAPGGKVTKTSFVDNYPGFISINGPDLGIKMYEHAMNLKPDYIQDTVENIQYDKIKKIFKIICLSKKIYFSYSVIIAVGLKENLIGVKGEKEFYGKGVSYCAVCDAAFVKNKPVIVVGGGNSALEEAIYLSDFGKPVYLVHRRNQFRADKIIVDRVKKIKNIKLILNSVIYEIKGDKKVNEIIVKNVKTNKLKSYQLNFIFIFIGYKPYLPFLNNLNIIDEYGFIKIKNNMETKIEGLFAAGDVVNKSLFQISTAINDGSIAGQKAANYIINKIRNNKL